MYVTSSIDPDMFTTGIEETSLLAGFAAFLSTYLIVILVVAVLTIIAQWKIFSKAGKPGWASIIPIYNIVVLFQIVGLSPWLILLNLIPFVGQIAFGIILIVSRFKLAKAFGKDIGWGFGLWLLPTIFDLILGFGSSEYVGVDSEERATAKVTEVKEETTQE